MLFRVTQVFGGKRLKPAYRHSGVRGYRKGVSVGRHPRELTLREGAYREASTDDVNIQ